MAKDKKYIRKYRTAKGKIRYVYPKDRSNNYLSTLAKVAPIFGAKALLGDLPRGAVEQAVEFKLRGDKDSFVDSIKRGLKGRGSGRALGAGLGILTAPIFLKGVELAASKDKKDQKKGLAYIGLSTAAYQLPKGGLEGYRAGRSVGDSVARALKKGGILGLTRSGYKLPAAAALGLSIAAGRKKGKSDKDPSFAQKVVIPTLTGAALGASSRSFESVVEQLSEGRPKSKAQVVKILRKALPSAGGGAVGGLLGGLILSTAVEGASKALKKEASLPARAIKAGAIKAGAGIVDVGGRGIVEEFVRRAPGVALEVGYEGVPIHALTAAAMGYKAPLGLDKLVPKRVKEFVADKQSTQFALGLKEGIAGRVDPGVRAGLMTTALMPELKIPRTVGQDFGKLLRQLPEKQRVSTLRRVRDYVKANPDLRVNPRTGEPTPVLHNIDDAIDKALGNKPVFRKSTKFPTFQKATQKLLYGGRGGILAKGLPSAGKQDKPSRLKQSLPPAALGLGGLLGMFGAVPGAPVLSTHLTIGGIKGAVPYLPVIGPRLKREGLKEARKGVIRGIFPGLEESKKDKAVGTALKYGLTPAVHDLSRMLEGATAHVKRQALPKARKGFTGLASKAVVPKKEDVLKALGRGSLVGMGGGLVAAAAKNKTKK